MSFFDNDNISDAFEELCDDFSIEAIFKLLFFILLRNKIGLIIVCAIVLFYISIRFSIFDNIEFGDYKKDVVVNFSYGSFEGKMNEKNEGKGVIYYNSGWEYTGDVKNGLRDGYGIMKLNPLIFRGTWKNNVLVGRAEKETGKGKFIGNFDNEFQLNGEGEFVENNGDRYKGYFRNTLFDGQGTYFYSNGDKYVGQFSKGTISGQGVYFWKNGRKYVGNFKNNQFHGEGTMYYEDGGQDVGYWENNKLKTIRKRVRAKRR